MDIDYARIGRLMTLSKGRTHDPYERFTWPERIPEDQPWCSEDLLTTYGTPYQDQLDPGQRVRLSKWEAVNFFSLNVHGIKGVLGFVSRCIYEPRYADVSEYLHVFMGEENFHMWYFAKACLDYAGKIYPAIQLQGPEQTDSPELEDLYMFASTLIFEEFVDYYNHKVGTTEGITDILKQVNYEHHVDESRHVSFGREMVPRLYRLALERSADPEATRADVDRMVTSMFRYFISLMYNPAVYDDADVHGPLGFRNGHAMRNALRAHPARKAVHEQWFKRSAAFSANRAWSPAWTWPRCRRTRHGKRPERTGGQALFGARLPVLQAGMGGVAQPELAAAVCEAGGFGMIGLYRHEEGEICELLARTAALTPARFGVNFVPFVLDAEQLLGRLACLADRPERPVVTFFGLPEARVLRSLPAGMDYGAQVGSREDLDAAFDAGLRFGVLQTVEAGGHHLGALTRAGAGSGGPAAGWRPDGVSERRHQQCRRASAGAGRRLCRRLVRHRVRRHRGIGGARALQAGDRRRPAGRHRGHRPLQHRLAHAPPPGHPQPQL